jgi:hypothetical protein
MAKKYIVDFNKDEKAELVAFSCFCNPWQVGGTSKSLISEPNR